MFLIVANTRCSLAGTSPEAGSEALHAGIACVGNERAGQPSLIPDLVIIRRTYVISTYYLPVDTSLFPFRLLVQSRPFFKYASPGNVTMGDPTSAVDMRLESELMRRLLLFLNALS